jgi:hypothetical protein
MTTISSKQWAALGRGSFESRMIAIIRRSHPAQAAAIDDRALAAEIRRQLAKAQAYAMTDELSAATYVYTAWLLGPDFDVRIPSLAQILSAPTMSPAAKSAALGNFNVTVFHALDTGAES